MRGNIRQENIVEPIDTPRLLAILGVFILGGIVIDKLCVAEKKSRMKGEPVGITKWVA